MNTVCRDIFKAIHEGKWISIEYKNKKWRTDPVLDRNQRHQPQGPVP